MRRIAWVFLVVLVLTATVAWLAISDEPPGFDGQAHPEFASMRQGGDGLARHGSILVGGWLFGCAIILCFSALVRFGALGRPGRERLATLLWAVTALYLGAWSWLVWAYRASLEGAGLEGAGPELVLTLPRPTAIMIFVLWPISMLFSALFVFGFDRWVLTDAEEAAFDRLVARTRDTGPDGTGTDGVEAS